MVGVGHRDAAQRALGRVVGDADPTIVEEARERVPALKHVVHRLGDIAVARELVRIQGLELGHQRRDARAPHSEALVDGAAVDLALDVEDRVDALHRLEGERRNDRELATRLGGDVGKLVRICGDRAPSSWPR
jgi:hypothetical protein